MSSVPVIPAERDMQTHLRQARHFEKKGWMEDSVREIAMARSTPEGRRDPVVFYRAASLARATDNIIGAHCMANATIMLNKGGVATAQARALKQELDRSFGYLEIHTSGDATSATLRIDLPTFFATAALQVYAEDTARRLMTRQELPIRVALPAGAYTISGQSITVLAGQSQELTLHPRNTRPAGAAPLVRARGGAAVHPSRRLTTPTILGTASVSTSWPVIRDTSAALHAGLRVGGTAPSKLPSGATLPAGADIGLQVSGTYFVRMGLDIHATASAGWASLSGLGWGCPLDGTPCSQDTGSTIPMDTLYLRDQGLQLRGTLGVDLRGIGEADGLGIGLDLGLSHTSGTLKPSTGETDDLTWTLTDPRWAVLAITPGISLSMRR